MDTLKLQFNQYPELACPHCESGYLHYKNIDFFDGLEIGDITIKVKDKKISIDAKKSDSTEKNYLKFFLWCDACWNNSTLAFTRRRGRIYMFFEVPAKCHRGAK